MITAIEATNYRGIRDGKLEGLTPLTVLVGPNGCGKSAMLDVAYVAASRSFVEALAWTIRRRRWEWPTAARWIVNSLAWQESQHTCRCFAVVRGHGVAVELSHQPSLPDGTYTTQLLLPDRARSSYRPVQATVVLGSEVVTSEQPDPPPQQYARLVFIEAGGLPSRGSLVDLFSEVVRRDGKDALLVPLREAIPDLKSIELLTDRGAPYVSFGFSGYSVPSELSSAGQVFVLRLMCELYSQSDTVFLVEEPETHLHPGSIRLVARLLRQVAAKGTQIILTTHSLEFIDALIDGATDAEMGALSVYRLQLTEGKLASSRTAGEDVRLARFEFESDLR